MAFSNHVIHYRPRSAFRIIIWQPPIKKAPPICHPGMPSGSVVLSPGNINQYPENSICNKHTDNFVQIWWPILSCHVMSHKCNDSIRITRILSSCHLLHIKNHSQDFSLIKKMDWFTFFLSRIKDYLRNPLALLSRLVKRLYNLMIWFRETEG